MRFDWHHQHSTAEETETPDPAIRSRHTALTQKVGNTCIVIEDDNGAAKAVGGYFNTLIPLLQLGFAPILMHICFFMQNLRPAFISGVYVDEPDTWGGCDMRPCRAEIRWYGGTDEGLVDV